MRFYNQILDSNGWLVFILFLLCSFLLNFVDIEYVSTNQIYDQYFQKLTEEKYGSHDEFVAGFEEDLADLDLDDEQLIDWEGLLIDMIFILVKFLFTVPLIAGLLLFGFVFERKYEHIKYEGIFRATMLANFVFLLSTVVMIIWFVFFQPDYSFENLRDFSPLHLISWIDRDLIPNWSYGLLLSINLYELVFVLLITHGICHEYNLKFKELFSRISLVYLGGIVVWHVLWVFIAFIRG